MDVMARKPGVGTRPQRMLLFKDGLKVVEPRRLATVTIASLPYRDISSVSLQQGLFVDEMVLRRRRGRPLVLQSLIPREASKVKAFLERRLLVQEKRLLAQR